MLGQVVGRLSTLGQVVGRLGSLLLELPGNTWCLDRLALNRVRDWLFLNRGSMCIILPVLQENL
jgi:hypothetical protein